VVDGSGNRKKEGRLRTEGMSAMLERGRCENGMEKEEEKNDVPVERVVKLAVRGFLSRRKISKQMLGGGKRTRTSSCNATNDII